MSHRYNQARKITILGALVNVLMGVIKLLGGAFFHSHALVADGIHSFSDLLTDAMVLFGSKYGSQDADETHPYGHQRIETATTLLLSLLLIVAGTCIAWDSLDEILRKQNTIPNALALPIALLSIVANEGLFYYTRHVGKRIRSHLIIANAWHHRADAASSLVVLVGILGSLAGIAALDALASVIVGFMIIKMGWSYGWNSVKELVDTAVDPNMIANIEHVISQVGGVQRIHQLRSRSMGQDVYIDVHVLVSPNISVSEGHYIAQHVHHALVDQLEHVQDVTVHIDPEDDETSSPSLHLPNRKSLEQKWIQQWHHDYPGLEDWVLHYLDGKLMIDLICSKNFTQWQELSQRAKADLQSELPNTEIRLLGKHEPC